MDCGKWKKAQDAPCFHLLNKIKIDADRIFIYQQNKGSLWASLKLEKNGEAWGKLEENIFRELI